jgi:hypothetical protein
VQSSYNSSGCYHSGVFFKWACSHCHLCHLLFVVLALLFMVCVHLGLNVIIVGSCLLSWGFWFVGKNNKEDKVLVIKVVIIGFFLGDRVHLVTFVVFLCFCLHCCSIWFVCILVLIVIVVVCCSPF